MTHVLIEHGRLQEGFSEWSAIRTSGLWEPHDWDGYLELSLFLGNTDAYHQACRRLLDDVASSTDPREWERAGRACLLAPTGDEELRTAAGFVDRRLTADKALYPGWAYPYFQFAKVLAEYRQGRPLKAMEMLQGPPSTVLLPAPTLLLAMCQHLAGRAQEARHTLAAAVPQFDWRTENAVNPDAWIYHVMRRKSEALVIPNFRDILAGKTPAADNDERLALQGVCEFEQLWHASARLYAEAFAADPLLVENLAKCRRYDAACAAALSGCRKGRDASSLTDTDCERWQDQAVTWLLADLVAWARKVDGGSSEDALAATAVLRSWKTDADLAGIRDESVINALPEKMRTKCRKMWTKVDEVLSRATKPKG